MRPNAGKTRKPTNDKNLFTDTVADEENVSLPLACHSTGAVGAYKGDSITTDLRKAIQNEEFVLYYQPRIDVISGQVVAAEALIRWQHASWGQISPGEFIHIAEETGLIVPLGNWVLETVCRKLTQWSAIGLPDIKISVNISARQLFMHDFVESVEAVLRKFQVVAKRLELEITETSLLPNEPFIVQSIQRLRTLGIAIFFDDFGTGYSTLSSLQHFELDGIKLDRSFVMHIPSKRTSTQIVRSVIWLAHSLMLTVVAEGVETQAQLDFLKQEKCDEVQGFFYSKPLPDDQFLRFVGLGAQALAIMNETSGEDAETLPAEHKYVRAALPNPIIASVTVIAMNARPLSSGLSEVLVLEVGPGGLRFVSNLRFPTNQGLVLLFKMNLFNIVIELEGFVVWSKEVENGLFQYSVKFSLDELKRNKFVPLLNQLAMELKSGNVPNAHFYAGNLLSFFSL
ncbi:putative bifunctional diguanylate cyclase/phosphodiesterase [Alicyclobacillus fodiniaquatilis]|uniref:Bifunctional diguanylate cyclase/phosphodiesterase n=1 Tax=Alicyclobacillus fodiniaquatilis TaxID=1661150 RepID=A0ABW4JMJ5_9BACL